LKTLNNLFSKITTFNNFLLAAKTAEKDKKYHTDVSKFHFKLESEILKLQNELQTKRYKAGKYHTFTIYDPKERLISAAPYRDRVVHHALCRIIEPIFEKTFITDSYANQKGKGQHKAIERYQYFAKRYQYVLKCDIRKFFPSLDHQILKQEIRRKIQCVETLWLIDHIIDNSNEQEEHVVYFPNDDLFTPFQRRRGLPIGNLTSQFWANVYMNRFDHFVKEELGKPYIRYVDDFVIFSNDKAELTKIKIEIQTYLQSLRLITHPNKTHIHIVEKGVPFLGFRNFPEYRYVLKKKSHRSKRHIFSKVDLLQKELLSPDELQSGLNSWLGHIRFGQSKHLENSLFRTLLEKDVNIVRHPKGSWRVF